MSGSISFFHAQLFCAKADDFNVEIVVGEAELVAQRDVGVVILEERAQDVGKFYGHFAGELWPDADQRGDGVERIEEEVRIDLALEGIEPGLKQKTFLLFELHFHAKGCSTL